MNELNKQSNWYDKTWLVIILCVVIFPIGLYALWQNSMIPKGWKILITIIISLIVLSKINNKFIENSVVADNPIVSSSDTVQLTQVQIDSIAEVNRQSEIEKRKTQTITAASLIQNYSENEVRADENFKNKYFFVEGTIHGIKKGLSDDIYITLNSSLLTIYVRCYFNDKYIAAKLEEGMYVTFYGRCDGYFLGVDMKDCRLVDNLEDIEKKTRP